MKTYSKDYRFASRNVTSISSVCKDEELAKTIRQSDYVRNETLRRLCQIPSYPYKTLVWKNRYYDAIKAKVIAELA